MLKMSLIARFHVLELSKRPTVTSKSQIPFAVWSQTCSEL